MKSYHYIVRGKVHGNNFQSWCLSQAQRLGLTGWVRNIESDKAEILLQGDDGACDEFAALLKDEAPISDKGPISCEAIDYEKTYDVFELRG